MADIAVRKSASQFPRILVWGIPIVLGLLAVLAIILFLLGKGGEGAVAQATAPTAAQASAPAPAVADNPVAPVAASAPAAPVAAPAPQVASTDPGVLRFENGLKLYEAAIAGNVPVGTTVQVTGVVDPWHRDAENDNIGPKGLVLFYIPALKEYYGSITNAIDLGGVGFVCEPPKDSPHNVTGIKSGSKVTARGTVQSVRPRGAYAASIDLANCTVSR